MHFLRYKWVGNCPTGREFFPFGESKSWILNFPRFAQGCNEWTVFYKMYFIEQCSQIRFLSKKIYLWSLDLHNQISLVPGNGVVYATNIWHTFVNTVDSEPDCDRRATLQNSGGWGVSLMCSLSIFWARHPKDFQCPPLPVGISLKMS